jgi:hypothetical protein
MNEKGAILPTTPQNTSDPPAVRPQARAEHLAPEVERVIPEAREPGAHALGRVIPEAPEPGAHALGRVIPEAPEPGAHALGRVIPEAPKGAGPPRRRDPADAASRRPPTADGTS